MTWMIGWLCFFNCLLFVFQPFSQHEQYIYIYTPTSLVYSPKPLKDHYITYQDSVKEQTLFSNKGTNKYNEIIRNCV